MRCCHAVAAAAATTWGLAACTAPSETSPDAPDIDVDAARSFDAPPPGEYQFVYVKPRSDEPFDFVKEIVLGSLDGRYFNLGVAGGGNLDSGRPAVSPDGTRVALVTYEESTNESRLVTRSLVGHADDERELSRGGQYGTPVWSPDGTMLAILIATNADHALHVLPADGSAAPRRLAPIIWGVVERSCHTPMWSPDGTELAFTDGNDVYSFVIATGVVVRRTLADTGEHHCHARWSPDGTALAFTRFGPAQDGVIDRVERTGGMAVTLAPIFASPDAGQLRWSPDGTRLVYVDVVGSGFGATQLLIVGASGSPAPQALATIAAAPSAGQPQWSPDGSTILYVDFDAATSRGALMTVTPGGGTPTRLGLLGVSIDRTFPSWLPAPIIR
jgi:Tol biopolymer transport system component